jgi:hypothetical protein
VSYYDYSGRDRVMQSEDVVLRLCITCSDTERFSDEELVRLYGWSAQEMARYGHTMREVARAFGSLFGRSCYDRFVAIGDALHGIEQASTPAPPLIVSLAVTPKELYTIASALSRLACIWDSEYRLNFSPEELEALSERVQQALFETGYEYAWRTLDDE